MKNGIKLSLIGQPTQQDYQDTIRVLNEDCQRYYGESSLEEFNHAVVINVEKKLFEEMNRSAVAEIRVKELEEKINRMYSYLESSPTMSLLKQDLEGQTKAARYWYWYDHYVALHKAAVDFVSVYRLANSDYAETKLRKELGKYVPNKYNEDHNGSS